MNIPIDTVVELLMGFSDVDINDNSDDPGEYIVVSGELIKATSPDDLRAKVREYLLTLVPKQVLLSECEEGKEYMMVGTPRRVYRAFIYAVDVEKQQRIARADQVQVIQPVEVK